MLLNPDNSPIHSSSSNPDMASTDWERSLGAYEYFLPTERIAQNPAVPRDSSRLLAIASPTQHQHCIFRDLPSLLKPGDLLVLNNTRVIPARLYGYKSTGSPVEVLLLEEKNHNTWLALAKPGKRLKPGAKIEFEPTGSKGSGGAGEMGSGGAGKQGSGGAEDRGNRGAGEENPIPNPQSPIPSPQSPIPNPQSPVPNPQSPIPNPQSPIPDTLSATVVGVDEVTGGRILEFDLPEGVSFRQLLDRFGVMPLPPYITQSKATPGQYQTVYAMQPGAIAAPTAGLHFTEELFARLESVGIERTFVTLHVGVGTFRPVDAEDVTTHKMHQEWVEVPAETVEKIRQTQQRGGRIIAVGTTVVRSIESAAISGQLQPFCGQTDLFIYPGYQWRVVEGLITNFHLPRSSLLMLVSALVGRKRLLDLYAEAIANQYRFYSFGDAMLILPEARLQTSIAPS